MALSLKHDDFSTFPTPGRSRDVVFQNAYSDHWAYPYDHRGHGCHACSPRLTDERPASRHRNGDELLDKTLKYSGDLGWSLDYATAWDFRLLVGNQTEVADVIDKIREVVVTEETPRIIFNRLDKALFGGKLKNMVYLRWKSHITFACGTTSAPGVVRGISRICIELNKVPFEQGYGNMDVLLDALIHQMIHAFFLVCCGAQPKGAKEDGRLADGLHFGVLLHTIQDISKQCIGGPLDLIFYTTRRRARDRGLAHNGMSTPPRQNDNASWISVSPRGGVVITAPADGQSHCSHDNRSIRPEQIKNWQVEHYARAIDLNMDQKGEIIYNFNDEGRLVKIHRLKTHPSENYIELIWDKKRIMIPRGNALKFRSLRRPLEKDSKFELMLPECSPSTLRYLRSFLRHGRYFDRGMREQEILEPTSHRARGPPVLVDPTSRDRPVDRMVEHIRVFKVAEAMKFEELQRCALKRLHTMPVAADDPIEALKELYNEGKDSGNPIHAELHKWARCFLARTDDHTASYDYHNYGRRDLSQSLSNYDKLVHWYGDRFQELYHHNMAFKDDCRLVSAELRAGAGMIDALPPINSAGEHLSGVPAPRLLSPSPTRLQIPRTRSLPPSSLVDSSWIRPAAGTASLFPYRSQNDSILPFALSAPDLSNCANPIASKLPGNRVCCGTCTRWLQEEHAGGRKVPRRCCFRCRRYGFEHSNRSSWSL